MHVPEVLSDISNTLEGLDAFRTEVDTRSSSWPRDCSWSTSTPSMIRTTRPPCTRCRYDDCIDDMLCESAIACMVKVVARIGEARWVLVCTASAAFHSARREYIVPCEEDDADDVFSAGKSGLDVDACGCHEALALANERCPSPEFARWLRLVGSAAAIAVDRVLRTSAATSRMELVLGRWLAAILKSTE